jgi:hypothetical protein
MNSRRAITQFWEAQARLCGVRGDFYRMAARCWEVGLVGKGLPNSAVLYCRMQARSCDAQGKFCQLLASFLSDSLRRAQAACGVLPP